VILISAIFELKKFTELFIEGIIFNSQVEINSFQFNYSGCTSIEGNVLIEGADITNLNGISDLNSIWSDFVIVNNVSLNNLLELNGY
jgi:hypothetical protein